MEPLTEILFRQSGAIRTLPDRRLEVLAAPFGSPDNRDALGEYFSARTDFMIDINDWRPTLYFHGFSPEKRMMKRPAAIGKAFVSRVDEEGLWMEVTLDEGKMANRIWDAAEAGSCRASTGSVNYLTRSNNDGEVLVWPLAELTLIDEGAGRHPVNSEAVATPLRAQFEAVDLEFPEAFKAGEATDAVDTDLEPIVAPKSELKGQIMSKEIKEAVAAALAEERAAIAADEALRAEIRAEEIAKLEASPDHRAMFNIGTPTPRNLFVSDEQAARGFTLEDVKETYDFIHALRNGGTPAMRVLEETEAAEGLAFVPQELDAQVQEMRDERSLVSKMGIFRRKSNRLIYNFVREDAGMGALALIAEEGAYIANEPAFALLPATVGKYGSMITATEELIEDQNTFQTWFVKACARKWALAENAHLFAVVKAGGTAGTHSATFTQPEIDAFMFQMNEEWKEGAHLVMEAATMAAIRVLLIATPRAYGEFPAFGGREFATFFGYPTHLNSNWETIGAGDLTETMSLINPEAIGWVERQGITIKVDPYGDALNGRIRYFPRVRFAAVNTQALGIVHYTDDA